jgi:hypothetical protein
MADATAAAFLFGNAAPSSLCAVATTPSVLPHKRPRLSPNKRLRLSTHNFERLWFDRPAPMLSGPCDFGDYRTVAMIEFLFIYNLARNPLRAIARRWACRSLYHITRGRRRCPECGGK